MSSVLEAFKIHLGKISVFVVLFLLTSYGHSTTLFSDNFNGSSLDTSQWAVLFGNSCISASGGNLNLSGYYCYPSDADPEHKSIESTQTFSQGVSGITASARINIGGDYQSFGFNRQSTLASMAIYFDSYDNSLGANANTIRAFIYTANPTGTLLFNESIPVSWGAYHDFTINWLPSEIEFLIDGNLYKSFAYTTGNISLPVNIVNDRVPLMLVDSINITTYSNSVPEPNTIWLILAALPSFLFAMFRIRHLRLSVIIGQR